VFSSDFKAAKQTATVSCELFARDETVGTVNLQYTAALMPVQWRTYSRCVAKSPCVCVCVCVCT
jgi:hypothetical protein